MIELVAFFALGLLLLVGGAELLVKGAASLGLRLGITPLVAGLTILAFGTSSPELAVGIDAALEGLGGITVGSTIGSNICNVAFILGVAAVIRPINIESQLVRKDVPLMILCSIGVTLLLIDGEVTRMNGTFLVLGVVAYTWHSIRNARQESNDIQAEFSEGVRDNRMHWGVEVGMVVVGLALLSVGGAILVQNGAAIAAILQVRPAIIALTVIAIGTSLPELATSMVASWRNQGDLAIGNVVGSNIFNLLAVIGISALVRPISHEGVEWTDMAFMIGTSVLLLPLVMTRKKLERWEGVLLIAIYIAYIVMVVKEDAIG